MKKFYLACVILFCIIETNAQQIQSLNCPIFVRMPCNSGINFRFPRYFIDDVRKINSFGDDYIVKDVSQRRGSCGSYISPEVVNPVVLSNIDDRYTDTTIRLPFLFTFYGATYDRILVTTNGFITFDTTKKGSFAHWSLSPGDFPNTSYDKALIAGPFHDLDPSNISGTPPPPDMKISYSVTGSAPNRKFIITYYKVPHYSSGCRTLLNTHQIIMHESTMVIDVFVNQKTICSSWNSGKAMIGLQNMARNKGIMAPNRKATSTPWQVLPTNPTPNPPTSVQGPEVWRFVPLSTSTPLYKDVTILDTNDNIIYTTDQAPPSPPLVPYNSASDTVRVPTDNSTFQIDFPTIPMPPIFGDTIIYIIKTRYNNVEVPGTFSYNIDTAYVFKDSIFYRTIDTTTSTCPGNNGSATISIMGGNSPYTYSLNGAAAQPAVFPLTLNSLNANQDYHVIVYDPNGCRSKDTLIRIDLDDANMNLRPLVDTTICVGSQAALSAQLNPDATNLTSFQWSAIPSNAMNNSTIANATNGITGANPTDTLQYTVTANWGQCQRKDSIIVNVLHRPIARVGEDTAICNQESTVYLVGANLDSSGSVSYEWTPSQDVENPNSMITVAHPTATTIYTLTVRDEYGCSFASTAQMTATLRPPVPANAGNDTIGITGNTHQLTASGGTEYLWRPNQPLGILNDSTSSTPVATLNHDQMFVVKVTEYFFTPSGDRKSCVGYDSVFVTVYPGPEYHTPNAFSPNGDGLNDIFRPIPSGITSTIWFKIFNRNGEMIYQSNKWMYGWDGNRNGNKQPPGTYVWIVKGYDRNNSIVERKGTVLLLR